MSEQDRIRTVFEDFNNSEAVNLVYTAHNTSSTILGNYWPLLVPLTCANLVVVRQESSIVGPSVSAGATGPYATTQEMVTLELTASDGSPWPVTFPCPVDTIFKADHTTIDPTNTDVADFIAWLLSYATTRDGLALVEYSRGWRWQLNE